jgi:23S rRNA (cytosine1962-C5)-methyltransferase
MFPLPEVRVNRKGAARVVSGHPWIYSSDILSRGNAQAGDTVRVTDPSGKLLGAALYSSTSQIALRFISPHEEPLDHAFLRARLAAAEAYRKQVVTQSDAYRLVFGESDGLPGLVVDRYGAFLVVQALNQAMDRASDLIVSCLEEIFAPRAIVARNDVPVRVRESLPVETRILAGTVPDQVLVTMNGLTLEVDLIGGQKTGVFLDQRENYLAAAQWTRGKVLDCFTSTGGFALHMAAHCDSVEAVDSSAAALKTAQANAAANAIGNIAFLEANVFDLLAGHDAAGRRFAAIVLDPPAFAKSKSNLSAALRGYKEINRRALRLLEEGGILFSCSCSHHVSEAALLEVIAEASLDARRPLRVIERRTQALDHPILLTVPETHYLKCLILQALN